MGNCAVKLTPEEKKALELDKKIASQNQKDHVKDSTIIKILLLGTGESGKSTIFKQVRELYSNNKFDKKELKSWAPMIYENINKQIKAILYANDKLGVELSNPYLTKHFDKDNYSDNTVITKDVANKLTELWNDAGFQRRWNCRAEYQVLECIEYYMRPENISRISQNPQSYIPTFDDIVHARVRTTGIITEKFRISSADFEMYDVGGQRSERKKWLNCFDNVTTVIFVAAINEYDQKLFEEAGEDRIREALRVWKDIVNRDEFKAVGFVLFLNKFDLFQEKLTKFPFRTDKRNQDYRGPDPMTQNKKTDQENAIYECAEYMKQKFLNQVDRRGVGAVNAYFTNATDSNNMRWVFETCEEQILRMNLSNSGFGNIQMFTQ